MQDMDGDGQMNGPSDWDTDGDGMPDGFEFVSLMSTNILVLDPWQHHRP